MAATVEFAKMNGLGNKILVVDMRGRKDRVTPEAAIALAADPLTNFDQIMAIHGGTMSIDSRLNEGTRVTLRLPLPPRASLPEGASR